MQQYILSRKTIFEYILGVHSYKWGHGIKTAKETKSATKQMKYCQNRNL